MNRAIAGPVPMALGVLGAAALLAIGLLAGSALVGTAAAAPVPDENSVDAGFARDMQVHHAQAVEMSVLVRDRTDDPQVRQVALDVMLTQQQQQGQMFGWLRTWGLPSASTQPVMGWMTGVFDEGMTGMDMGASTTATDSVTAPPANPMERMGLATQEQLAALRDADGVRAERIYLQLLLAHHRGGVEMSAYAAENARQPQVVELAGAMSAAQAAEMTIVGELLDARGGPVDL